MLSQFGEAGAVQKLRSVQALRALAACAVVVMHSYDMDHQLGFARLGAAGVDLFFVISGFIIATIPKKSARQFLFDRAWRIYPVWLIVVIPCMFLTNPGLPQLLASLTLWPIYGEFVAPVLSVGWTLSFELLFYVSAAVALRLGVKVPLAIFGACFFLGLSTGHPLFEFLGSPMIFEFLFGVIVARLPRDERFAPLLLALAVLALAVSPLSIYSADYAMSGAAWARPLFWGFPAAIMLYAFLCMERRFSRAGTLLGDASYSIYLIHLPVIQLASLHWAVEIALAVCAGVALHLMIERPIQKARVSMLLRVPRAT